MSDIATVEEMLWSRIQKKKYSYAHGRGRAFIDRCYQIQHRLEMIGFGHDEYKIGGRL